jgi:CTP synthase (UTP-ammonia lyase)
LYCSLRGLTQQISIVKYTIGYSSYNKDSTSEQFLCNYGVNPKFQDQIVRDPLKVSAVGPEGEIRMIELRGHRFYVATLFVPQMISSEENPHPLITDFVKATVAFETSRSML